RARERRKRARHQEAELLRHTRKRGTELRSQHRLGRNVRDVHARQPAHDPDLERSARRSRQQPMSPNAKAVSAFGLAFVAVLELCAACGEDERLSAKRDAGRDASPDGGASGAGGSADATADLGEGGTFDASDASSDTAPLIPIGFDAYRMWDRL